MFIYVNGKETEIGTISGSAYAREFDQEQVFGTSSSLRTTWARRRNNIDVYLEAFDTASRFIWTKVQAARDSRQARSAVRSFQHLDDRTLSDIGLSRAEVGLMTSGPTIEPESGRENRESVKRRHVYHNSLFDGLAS
ncbi:MAG: DUF1127 domain-containing protein [Alphaproteobacteria bacterium]|jgi:uncharacterized protein YjiS (DUF1127 family)|nr:DUF1127 domain-containing protein [Alphaproteobacteria bacterium]MBT4018621.1 DUF1127 domain-containing protein [Alphaproteobacteria bacterium]MBT5158393.1 DUF1127 domain-containing protein [Alphaproteobacteria bacterium]